MYEIKIDAIELSSEIEAATNEDNVEDLILYITFDIDKKLNKVKISKLYLHGESVSEWDKNITNIL